MRLFFKYWLLLIIATSCLLTVNNSFGQEMDRFLDPYFENFTTADRLPFDKINSGFIDEFGFLWLTSVHGLLKYDGYEFETFRNVAGEENELIEGRTEIVLQDPHGYLWIGGTIGLTRMDLKTGHLLKLVKDPDKYPILGKRTSHIELDSDSCLWIRTEIGLNRINTNDLSVKSWNLQEHLGLSDPIFARSTFSWDKNEPHILWLGSEKGLLKLNTITDEYDHFVTPFFEKNKEKLGLTYDYHSYIHADSSGHIYTGRWGKETGKSRNEGMHVFDSDTETWRVITLPDREANPQSLRWIEYKSPDELWIHTPNRGLGIYHKIKETFRFINHDPTDPHSLPHPSVRLLLFDSNENIIMGTMHGLSFSYKQRTIFKYHELIPEEAGYDHAGFFITDILETDDNFYVVSYRGEGLCIIDKHTNRQEIFPLSDQKGFPHQAGYKIIKDYEGKCYITGREGLKVFDPSRNIIADFTTSSGEKIDVETPIMYGLFEDSKHRIWIGTVSGGVVQISADRETISYHKYDENHVNSLGAKGRILDFVEDKKGRIWITSYDGVSCFDPERNFFINYSDSESEDTYLPKNYAFNCAIDSLDRLWLSSYYLLCIDESQPPGEQISQTTIKDGLPGSIVRTMHKHPDGTLWMVTDNGLVHFNPYSSEMKTYTTREGLRRDQMWDESFYINDEGKVRLYTKRGFLEYQPDVEASLKNSPLAFSKFEVNGEEVEGYKDINFTDSISLHHSQNSIAFTYALLNYAPKMDNVYSYKLDGLDSDWIDAGKRRYSEYKNLPGGYYTFFVKAKDKLGNDGANVLSKVVFIGTPFWKTTWFKALIVALILGLIYLFYRYRIRIIRKEKDLLTRLTENEMIALRAQMNPHFLFNTINSIKRFIIKNETETAADHLTKFSRLVRLILNNSNSQSIPLKDEMEALRLYIEMEAMRFDDKFDYILDVAEEINSEEVMIPPMLMQPFVENAIWHGLMHKTSGRGQLSVNVELVDGVLECVISDNGVGREKAAEIKSKSAIKKKSLGMTLTQRRIELLDNFSDQKIMKFEIDDLYNQEKQANGTKVTIRIPIQDLIYIDSKKMSL